MIYFPWASAALPLLSPFAQKEAMRATKPISPVSPSPKPVCSDSVGLLGADLASKFCFPLLEETNCFRSRHRFSFPLGFRQKIVLQREIYSNYMKYQFGRPNLKTQKRRKPDLEKRMIQKRCKRPPTAAERLGGASALRCRHIRSSGCVAVPDSPRAQAGSYCSSSHVLFFRVHTPSLGGCSTTIATPLSYTMRGVHRTFLLLQQLVRHRPAFGVDGWIYHLGAAVWCRKVKLFGFSASILAWKSRRLSKHPQVSR